MTRAEYRAYIVGLRGEEQMRRWERAGWGVVSCDCQSSSCQGWRIGPIVKLQINKQPLVDEDE